ncbi:conserved putative membrane protein [Candidatus Protochlamydia naegleriophila]|uniref:Conserved putative membrane protein n=1 Tax=Candidatus Protochlamydia naegleriophila TaxID=389348 RepID=A0A0U5JJ50_9BACT|nr:MFS transporter [Candidatus Protochlamydia naegleriophila]CUI18005.1 conserved putative membrane protein [Candidatus Protochlamydia naegleriophila]
MISSFLQRFSSFTYLNVTQFLGALNDNIYKLLIVYFFIQLEGIEYSHQILASTGATFVIPFLLFSAISGTLADRFSKRDIIVTTKILELVIMGLGVCAFAFQSKWGSYAILFLLATQSAIFGPSKYGIVPELVAREKISKANGLMTSFTFLAIILGTFLSSFLIQITGRNFIISSIFCTFIALIGLVTSFCIEPTPPSGSEKKIQFFFLKEIFQTLKLASQEVSLLPAIFGSAYFLFVGAFTQLNIIPFAVQSLHLSDIEGGYLFFLTALGIGTGSLIAGKISGRIVELGLVPIGALGISICSFFLDIFSDNIWAIIPTVTCLGVFGGIFEIPLDSYIQVASPKQSRGQMVAATNFFSFVGVLLASALIYLNSEILGIAADKGFSLMGFLAIGVTIAFSFQFFDYLARFIASILSKLHFRTVFKGKENIPDCPALYVCTHTAWNDTLLLLGSQRRRMRFFIEQEQDHSRWMRRLYRLLRVVFIPDIEPLEKNQECLMAIQNTLKKGISVCIFIQSWDIYSEVEKLNHSAPFNHIIEAANYPIIPVRIEKGIKHPRFQFLKRLLNKYRVPASVAFGSLIYTGHQSLLESKHEHELCFED